MPSMASSLPTNLANLAIKPVRSKLKCPLFVASEMSGFGCSVYSYTRSRRRCGKVGIPRSWRDFQARWESLLWDVPTARLFHSVRRRVFVCVEGHTLGAITSQPTRSVGEADGTVQVLVNQHGAAGQCPAPLHPLNLQRQVLKADGVVAVHRALKLQREDQVQILAARTPHKRAPALCRRHLKAAVELAHVFLPQKPVGLVHGRDPVQPQLLRQPSLPGAEAALAASPRLRRVSRDHLHSQLAKARPTCVKRWRSTLPPT